ncbi:MAG: O-antigen ligase family protein, partial [Aestuariivirga sp.]
MRIFLAAIYLCVVLLYTAFTKLSAGLPVRTLVLVLLSVIIFICYFRDSRQFFRQHIEITSVFAALGVIGTILTYWQQGDVVSTLDGLTSNIVQPYLILFSTMMLINIIGLRTVALLSLSGAALSGLVALLQFSNIEIGWRLREIIGEIQHEPAEIQNYVASRSRALGLSLSPIVFSYQIMSAYIALSVMYRFGELRRLLYYGSFFLILIAFLANGTRSAILAIIASEMLMQLRSGRLRSLLPVAAIAAIGAAVYLYAGATGSRIAETEDASALGRMVLYDYGLRLATDHPFGLGWNFDPGGYAWLYWEYLSDYVNADGAFRLGLHNAYLNFFLVYGLTGTLVAAIVLMYDPRFVFISLLYLFAYVVHAFFHNNG